ncbi:hypothetical protein QL285_000419 [Trifolium repens]|nr:hypothetical protein QL285_000419 [Trifolium repens]
MLNDKRNNFNEKGKEKWVPKTEEKEKQVEEEEEAEAEAIAAAERLQNLFLLMEEKEKQRQQRQQQQEEKKKVYSPLPSNYVTLAQLKERWLKQKNQKQEEEKKEEDYPPLEQRHVDVVPPTNVTVSRLNIIERNLRRKRDDSADNRRVIGVEFDEKGKSVIVAGFSDNVTVSRSNPGERYRCGNRDGSVNNHRVIGVESEERGKSVIGAEIADNATVSRLNPVERNRGGKHEEPANNRIGVESEDGRKSVIGDGKGDLDSEVEESKTKNMNGFNPRQRRWKNRAEEEEKKGAFEEGSATAKGNEVAEKTSVKIESKEMKKVNSGTVEEEAEQKFRVLSLNSGNGKQNLNFRKMNYGFRDSQSLRNNRNGGGRGGSYSRYGGGGGGGGHFKELQSSKMIWVKKDKSVEGN